MLTVCCECVDEGIGSGPSAREGGVLLCIAHALFVGIGELERVRLKVDLSSTVRAALLFRLLGTEALALGHNHVQVSLVAISGL